MSALDESQRPVQALAAISQLLLGTSSRGHDGILEHCSISSDSFGSLPVFDATGQLVKYEVRTSSPRPSCMVTMRLHQLSPKDLAFAGGYTSLGRSPLPRYSIDVDLMQVAEPKELFTCLQHLFCDQDLSLDLSLDDALALFTVNPAHRLKLLHKGRVRVLHGQRAHVLTNSDLTEAVLPGFMHDYSSLVSAHSVLF